MVLDKLIENIKYFCYHKLQWRKKCVCGGKIRTHTVGYQDDSNFSYYIECGSCGMMYCED